MEELTCEDIFVIISRGEDYNNQFKLNFESIDKLASEIVAFLNSDGGRIFVGVTNSGKIVGLTGSQIDSLNQWISNACRNKIYPASVVKTQTINCEGGNILIINVPRGENKPYALNKTDVWIKVGSDKRKATIEDISRLLQESGRLRAEENEVDLDVNETNLNIEYFIKWFRESKEYEFNFEKGDIKTLFNNWKLAKGTKFTLAGLLLFGKSPEFIKPQFIVKTVYWKMRIILKIRKRLQEI